MSIQKIQSKVDDSVLKTINSASFINGPSGQKLSKAFREVSWSKTCHSLCKWNRCPSDCFNGLDLKPGDEVITPDFTYASTIEVILLLGLTPVLVDIDIDTFNIDVSGIKNAITSKTKAIIPVHLFGQVASMNEILEIAQENDLYIIEDNAQSLGSNFTFKDGSKKKAGYRSYRNNFIFSFKKSGSIWGWWSYFYRGR